MAGMAAAHLFVGGVRGEAARVAHRGAVHTVGLPEDALGTPEAPEPEDRGLEPLGERRLDRVVVHEVGGGHGHLLGASGQ